MAAITATTTATLYLVAALTSPASVDPFAADPPAPLPVPAVDPLDTSVPSPDGDVWSAPPPPPPPAPPPPPPVRDPPPRLDLPPEPAALPEPSAVGSPPDAGKRTITIGLIVLGGGVVAGVASIYAWQEHNKHAEQLTADEQLNDQLMMNGLPTSDTSAQGDKVELYRNLTIGLGVTAGVLAIVGGSIALAGLSQRRRATRVTLRPAGITVRF